MSEKRSRCANFSDEECVVMANLIKEYEKVIECKKTDLITIKDKEHCWEKITDIFNSKSGERRRTSKELKMKYDNIKRNLKRKIAANKLETMRTGGGVPKIKVLTTSEEIVYSMTRLAVDGLPGKFDEDEEFQPIDIEAAEIIYEDDKLIEKSPTDMSETTSYNWSKWTPVALRKPVSKVLDLKETLTKSVEKSSDCEDSRAILGLNDKEGEGNSHVTITNNNNISNKRHERRSLITSKTPKRYPKLQEPSSTNELIAAKLGLIKLQCAHYSKLLEEIDQQKSERDLKIQILKVDLEMKLLELAKQKNINNI